MELAKVVVVVPAHNERAHLPRCLRALATAAVCLPVPVLTVVVLDASDDGSDRLVEQFGPDIHFVRVDAGNVGAARAAGFEYARPLCDTVDPARTWYATTDADSLVPVDWLLRMTASDADMVLGVVRVPTWRHYPADVARRYLRGYRSKGPATITFTVPTWASGRTCIGRSAVSAHCKPVRTSSSSTDSRRRGLRIHRDAELSVATSDRRHGRAPGGFAHHLRELSGSVFRRTAERT